MTQHSDARERVLEVAERLFGERGYNAVTLRDIAAEVGIRHASLYHHVPGGKEALFVEVTERNLHRHQMGLEKAVMQPWLDFRGKLRAAADWLISQPPLDLLRMKSSDMPSIQAETAHRLTMLAYAVLREPIQQVLEEAQAAGLIRTDKHLTLVTLTFVTLIQGVHAIPMQFVQRSQAEIVDDIVDLFLEGLRIQK